MSKQKKKKHFKKKSDNECVHAAEEEDDNSSSSEEHADDKYIDFEAEQELFKLFNPRPRAANPSTSTGPKPYASPEPKTEDKGEYVPFKLFDENGNRNSIKFYDSDDDSKDDYDGKEMEEEESVDSEGLEVPDLIEYNSEIDSDSDNDEDVEVKREWDI